MNIASSYLEIFANRQSNEFTSVKNLPELFIINISNHQKLDQNISNITKSNM